MVVCVEKGKSSVDVGSPSDVKRVKSSPIRIGDRSEKACRMLWEAIPEMYHGGYCFTDFWAAYQAVIPEEQQMAVGKETVGSFRSQNTLLLKIPGDA